METTIIKIGNSKGIIIPAEILKRMALAEKNSVTLTLEGDTLLVRGGNQSTNCLKTSFFVCPVCGNVITGSTQASVSCHGISLQPLEAGRPDNEDSITIERVEDECFISIPHEMTKHNYISFIAAVSPDRVQMIKLFPEGNAEARFQPSGVKAVYFYSTTEGLFKLSAAALLRMRK